MAPVLACARNYENITIDFQNSKSAIVRHSFHAQHFAHHRCDPSRRRHLPDRRPSVPPSSLPRGEAHPARRRPRRRCGGADPCIPAVLARPRLVDISPPAAFCGRVPVEAFAVAGIRRALCGAIHQRRVCPFEQPCPSMVAALRLTVLLVARYCRSWCACNVVVCDSRVGYSCKSLGLGRLGARSGATIVGLFPHGVTWRAAHAVGWASRRLLTSLTMPNCRAFACALCAMWCWVLYDVR